MGVIKCKVCERELPENVFAVSRWGGRVGTCNECRKSAIRMTRQKKREEFEKLKSYNDELFTGKDPVEVINIISRAKKWLEARGYEISVKGSYTKRMEIKF